MLQPMQRARDVVESVLARAALLTRWPRVLILALSCGWGCGDSVLVARELASEAADPVGVEEEGEGEGEQTAQDVRERNFPIRGKGPKRWATHGGNDGRPRNPFTMRYAAQDAGAHH
jgi:hypothetical protein